MTEEPGGRQPISSQSQAQLKQLWGTYMLFFVVASLIYISNPFACLYIYPNKLKIKTSRRIFECGLEQHHILKAVNNVKLHLSRMTWQRYIILVDIMG